MEPLSCKLTDDHDFSRIGREGLSERPFPSEVQCSISYRKHFGRPREACHNRSL